MVRFKNNKTQTASSESRQEIEPIVERAIDSYITKRREYLPVFFKYF